jgi:hypothetical protein
LQLVACPGDAQPFITPNSILELPRDADDGGERDEEKEAEFSNYYDRIVSEIGSPSLALYPRAGEPRPAPPPPPPPPPPLPKVGSSNTGTGLRLKTNDPGSRNPSPERAPSPKDFQKNPANVEPGTGETHDTTTPRSIAEIETAGRRQWEAYNAAVKIHTRDTQVVQDTSQLPASTSGARTVFLDVRSVKGYRIQSKKISNPTSGNLKSISLFRNEEIGGFDIKNNQAAQQIQINPSSGADAMKSIIKMTIDDGGRYFIKQDSFKATDQTGSGIPLNEMAMQSFLRVAGANADKFSVMFIVNIQNQEFWNVVRANYDDYKAPFEKVLAFKAGTVAFNRLLGTQNINSMLFGFQNHYIALGRKMPTRIIVIPKEVPNAGELSIALVFT